jgi:hypothetical protein
MRGSDLEVTPLLREATAMQLQNVFFTTIILGTLVAFSSEAEPKPMQPTCEVSKGIQRNDALWAIGLPEDGKLVFRPNFGFVDGDGALGTKVGWVRRIPGELIVGGRRLDADAPPARAYMNSGYGNRGFQATYLLFPSPGCWAITGRIGDRSLTFVLQVEKEGNGPDRKYEGLPPGGFWYQTTLESGRTVPSSD